MQLNISAQGFELTDAIRSHVREKTEKLWVFDDIQKSGNAMYLQAAGANATKAKAEIVIHIAGKQLVGKSEDDDLYLAITHSVQKVHRQIVKHHEQITDKQYSKPRTM